MTPGEIRKLCAQAAALKREPFYAFKREPVLSNALTAALDCIEQIRGSRSQHAEESALARFDRAIENLDAPKN